MAHRACCRCHRRLRLSRQAKISEAGEQRQHRRAGEKQIPDSQRLRERSRNNQADELRE